jgi:hypothetical protein
VPKDNQIVTKKIKASLEAVMAKNSDPGSQIQIQIQISNAANIGGSL